MDTFTGLIDCRGVGGGQKRYEPLSLASQVNLMLLFLWLSVRSNSGNLITQQLSMWF